MENKHPIIIKSIKEISFMLNEELFIPDSNKIVEIKLFHKIGVNTEFKNVRFTLGVYIHYRDSDARLSSMEINNFFELPKMDEYEFEDNNVILPGDILLTMVGESIAHLRVMFFQKLSGTPYRNIIIPYDDPAKVTAYFFPTLIKNKKGELSLRGVLED